MTTVTQLPDDAKYYSRGGTNWMWYALVSKNDDTMTATIFLHDRLHSYHDTNHPPCVETFRMIEGKDRVVTQICLGTEIYEVTNPRDIFSFGHFA